MVSQVPQAPQVFKVMLDQLAAQEPPVQQDPLGQLVQQEPPEPLEFKVQLASEPLALKVQLAPRAVLGQQVPLVYYHL
jgi:hypothetical protein